LVLPRPSQKDIILGPSEVKLYTLNLTKFVESIISMYDFKYVYCESVT